MTEAEAQKIVEEGSYLSARFLTHMALPRVQSDPHAEAGVPLPPVNFAAEIAGSNCTSAIALG